MSRFTDLIDEFVNRRNDPDPVFDHDSAFGYRIEGHELIETYAGITRTIAGWTSPGTIDTMLWITINWSGPVRVKLEEKIRRIPMVVLTVMPTEEFDDHGADVIWWSIPVECMSCGEYLADDQREIGLCEACQRLIAGHPQGEYPDNANRPGYEQRRGLHGDPLPRSRPSKG